MNEIHRVLLAEWLARGLPSVKPRRTRLETYANLKVRKAIAVTGFRRVGKTFLILGLAERLLRGKNRKQVVYLNLEDERIPLTTEFLTDLLPAIKEYYGATPQFLLLDEIQNVPGWSKWARRIHDSGETKLFLTGSSSKMSSKEIPTELRGRFLEVNLFPLSFREFLEFKGLSFDASLAGISASDKAGLLNALQEYVTHGGLPEIVLGGEDKRGETINSYYQTVVRRDIIERNKVKNEEALKALLQLLLNSTQYSISKLYDTLKSAGHAVGKTTLQHYLSYIEGAYFAFPTRIFSYKAKDRLAHPRKIYFIDNSFINRFSTKFSQNNGRLYENLAAVKLKTRLGPTRELCYWKSNDAEVDFVVEDNGKAKQLIQVCYDVSEPAAKKREARALLQASKELECNDLTVITKNFEKTEEFTWFKTTRTITYTPLWKWLLQ
ncbi:ATP-binding protein [Candidatus Micrarchaeota archaeon]|nr:ATP-binding protein [Candidatus Micrarchaeota archaeon]MBI5177219.1 ATP-binding protein [Candidatus Micrarchaeota archaeon]